VIWAVKFGRTPYAQGEANREKYDANHTAKLLDLDGRRRHQRRRDLRTHDDFGFKSSAARPHSRFAATILHCLGIDHTRLTFVSRPAIRLTDVHGEVVKGILA